MEERRRALKKWLKAKAKERTKARWKSSWEKETVGKWTRKLIPNPETWNSRKHGEINYFIT